MSALLIRGGEVDGRRADVMVDDGRIVAVGADLRPSGSPDTWEVDGGAVLPGLHDHHLHLLAMAAAAGSLDLTDPAGGIEGAVRRAAADVAPGGWLRAVGHHAAGGDVDRARLDDWAGPVPVRVQDASGALWILNSAALAAVAAAGIEVGADAATSGWILREDAALAAVWPAPALDLAAVGHGLAARGVTGVTDATPFTDPGGPTLLAEAVADGRLPQHVVLTGHPFLDLSDALPVGPAKVIIGDHHLPELGDLVHSITAAHAAGRPVAVHCVTADALALLLAAWAEVGAWPADRVEHGAVIPATALPALAAFGVTVVTQPGFVAERGDRYRAEVDEGEQPDLWRCATLLDSGVRVGAGTDAPYGPADPWRAMAAAVDRRTPSGATMGDDERLAPDRALGLFLGAAHDPGGPPRRLDPGAAADLCVLDRPRADAMADLAAVEVTASFVAGVAVSV
ncbi:MAG TPA: amidohydrolase family protein [Acidimicrobiales bacterium]